MRHLLTRLALRWLRGQGFHLDTTYNLTTKPAHFVVTLQTVGEHPTVHHLSSGTVQPYGRPCDVVLAIVPK